MVIPDRTATTGTSDTTAAEHDEQHHRDHDRDPLKRPRDSSRLIGDPPHGGGDPPRLASDTQRPGLRAQGESNYSPRAPHDANRPLRIRLPEHDPVIAPAVARALLRLILNTVGHQPTGPPLSDDHRRTP